ncbi:MAG: GTP pyrophosphokinase [Oleiphilus sp.]|nr:MAG: GTP pyrophosphokinase [Oleiphilus sp.]
MNTKKQLALAIDLAVDAHRGQVDRAGMPYILHPLYVMQQCIYDLELAAIAVLHDVVEDSTYTAHMLRDMGFSERVLSALDLLTRKEGTSYDEYIDHISTNYDALRVKLKDLNHNSDLTRLGKVSPKDLERAEKYHAAYRRLCVARDQHLSTEQVLQLSHLD